MFLIEASKGGLKLIRTPQSRETTANDPEKTSVYTSASGGRTIRKRELDQGRVDDASRKVKIESEDSKTYGRDKCETYEMNEVREVDSVVSGEEGVGILE